MRLSPLLILVLTHYGSVQEPLRVTWDEDAISENLTILLHSTLNHTGDIPSSKLKINTCRAAEQKEHNHCLTDLLTLSNHL